MSDTTSLISGRRLARNAIWNFGGLAAPFLSAVVAVPILIAGMGKERFGLLSIIWMGIGYFSLFDVGLGRALTKLVAERLGGERAEELPRLIWTALWVILAIGCVGMLGVVVAGPVLIERLFNVPVELRGESIAALRILAMGIPIVVLTTALMGVLAAHQRFASISVLRAILGTFTFIAPVITLQFTPSLAAATAALLAGRVLAGILYYALTAQSRPELLRPSRPRREWLRPLLSLGGWLSVSNLVSPIMVYFDRFFIASLLTLAAVTYYVTPFEVVSRILVVAGAVTGVLFPALATAFASDRTRLVHLYEQASRVLLVVMIPPVAIAFLLAPEALGLWLTDDFRQQSTAVVHWLAVGIIANTMAQTPFAVLQSGGRADLVAKLHLIEVPLYLAGLWILTREYGIAGAAAAWTIRATLDAGALLWLARRQLPELRAPVARSFIELAILPAPFLLALTLDSVNARVVASVVVTALAGVVLWPTLRKLTLGGR
jgi:O-antigen/teichoic acid export membrane protein